MIQKTLNFDTPAKLSRKSDKITSQASAAETEKKLGTIQWFCLVAIRTASKPITANEAAKIASGQYSAAHESYRKRVHELVRADLIEDAGERACEVTGKLATVYKVKAQP